jgi:hypothetical protein
MTLLSAHPLPPQFLKAGIVEPEDTFPWQQIHNNRRTVERGVIYIVCIVSNNMY